MSRWVTIVILFLLSAMNVITLSFDFSQQSKAAISGMNYRELISDPNFIRAVKSIAEACHVNVNIAKLRC